MKIYLPIIKPEIDPKDKLLRTIDTVSVALFSITAAVMIMAWVILPVLGK